MAFRIVELEGQYTIQRSQQWLPRGGPTWRNILDAAKNQFMGGRRYRRAVVTGASSGIGREFCRQLTTEAQEIIAVARRAERLRQLQDEFAPRQVICCEADLASEAGLRKLLGVIESGAPVDLLVNNAGFLNTGAFANRAMDASSGERSAEMMVQLHVMATLRLCHAVLPGMRSMGFGDIINVSSMTVFDVVPGAAVYAASKSFLLSFSRTLAEEERAAGIVVQSLHPGWTRTELFQQDNEGEGSEPQLGFDPSSVPDGLWATAEQVVQDSLTAVKRGSSVCIPGSMNRKLAQLGLTRLSAATRSDR